MLDFPKWLDQEIAKHNWTRADLARRAGINQSTLSMIYSGQRSAGNEVCLNVARALDLPPEQVFRAAGLLPELPTFRQAVTEILAYKLNELNDKQLDELILLIDYIIQRDKNQDYSPLHGLYGK